MSNVKEFFKLNEDVNISSIMVDSRIKLENSIFFCLVGLTVDGHSYVDNAIDNGAVAIVHSKDINEKKDNVTYIKVEDTTKALNEFADYFYGYPSHNMKIYGVTGTNGKTTTTYIIYDLLNKLNTKAGYIGTLGYKYDSEMHDQFFTTPNINDLHLILSKIKNAGCEACSIEVSSQGLDLHRCDSVDFDVAIFSNLTHDHLDYHLTYRNYFNAKARLFENMKKDGIAIINVDDEYGNKMLDRCSCKSVTYAIDSNADYKVTDLKLYSDFSEFNLTIRNACTYFIKTNEIAKFNIYNLVSAIAALVETGYKIEDIIPLLENISSIPGRCMHINEGQDFEVIVDYAHTPDGFVKMLDYAKMIKSKNSRIIVVFGLRGSGDMEKRPIVGSIVDDGCDEIFITADDNHEEDINHILDGIQSGIKKHIPHRYEFREDAIKAAIDICKSEDILLILSKGDDQYNKINGKKEYYEGDNNIASKYLKEKLQK